MKGKYILAFVVVLILVIIGWRSYQINRPSDTLQTEKQQPTLPIQNKQFTKPEVPSKNVQPETKPVKVDIVPVAEEFDLRYLELPLPSFSQLSQNEQERGFSLMMDEFDKWLSVRTITADIKIRDGLLDPNNGELARADTLTARLKAEVIPLQKKTFSRRVKIRVRIESEEHGIVVLKENIYDWDTPPVVWDLAGKPLSDDDISHLQTIFPYDAIPLEEMFMMIDAAHDDYSELQAAGVRDLHKLANYMSDAMSWKPIQATTQEDAEKHFKGQKQ